MIPMGMRSQSAMEYLMTYGWAILIIAVILGVLFSLGVFNPVNYAPKVPAGNCHVFRPNGPGTSFDVNLVGTCSGFLPQYVAQFNGKYGSNSGEILTPTSLVFGGSVTVTAWVYYSYSNSNTAYLNIAQRGPESYGNGYFSLFVGYPAVNDIGWEIMDDANDHEYGLYPTTLPKGAWHFVAATFDAATGVQALYLDTQSYSTTRSNVILGTSGEKTWTSANYWNGSIANIQIYDAALNANEIQYLYDEGIGGAPVYLQHLAEWWPLNGDAKDYSGNGYDSTPTNLAFNGSWTTGYSQP